MIYISWIGNALICLGIWHVGNKKRWAFLFSIAGELAWITVSVHAHMWSLAFICCVFAVLAGRNWYKWR